LLCCCCCCSCCSSWDISHAFSVLQCNLQFAICNLQFSIFDFYIISLLRPISTGIRIVQYSSKYCIIVQFHHAFSILHHCMHLCNAALPGSLAWHTCLAALLPGSLARQPCPAALPGSLARQPCPAALPGSLARHPCLPALQKSLQAVLRP
jgi:hypothetical protein